MISLSSRRPAAHSPAVQPSSFQKIRRFASPCYGRLACGGIDINLFSEISSIFRTKFYYIKGMSETIKLLEGLQALRKIFVKPGTFKSKNSLPKSPKSFPKRKDFSYTLLLISV